MPLAFCEAMPSQKLNGGCAWETFGSAGSFLEFHRFANPRTAATHICLATDTGRLLENKESYP
ncbi:hypothetical protein FD951_10845 [Pseudomonas chlororaphis subsp. aurantiaca]|nr:hypothetical protein FD951_10845 [Pseudomonas chlororaphis subsp. aurantiaca]